MVDGRSSGVFAKQGWFSSTCYFFPPARIKSRFKIVGSFHYSSGLACRKIINITITESIFYFNLNDYIKKLKLESLNFIVFFNH